MRFAYIDSQGNEVSIPSVDALGLRIELGAIRPDTELYDAQADRWGPAESHEIFHTLSRDVDGDGFVAPPPVAPPPSVPERKSEPEAPAPQPPKAAAPKEQDEDEQDEDTSFGLTLAADPGPRPEPAAPGLELASNDLPLLEPDPVPDPPPPAPAAEGDAGFDFADLAGGLELEPTSLDTSAAGGPESGLAPVEPGRAEEQVLDFGAPSGAASGGLEPLPELTPSPVWVEQDGPGGGREVALDLGRTAAQGSGGGGPGPAAAVVAAEAPARQPPQRKRGKTRPSRPRRARLRSVAGPIVSAVVLAAGGVGAYVSWPILSERLGLEPPRPPVVIPEIPADLDPLMRQLGDRALAETFAALDERTRSPEVPEQPPEDWLFGVYLANASRFEGVPAFWTGMQRFMAALRADEADVFHARYLEAARSEAAGDTVMTLVERADSGFAAASAAREEVYRRMDELVDAALTLHVFLVANESGIAYEPAAIGVSGDPLLEAVPESEEVRTSMWDMLENLTNALDALGTLDLVSRQELLAILLERVRGVAIQ